MASLRKKILGATTIADEFHKGRGKEKPHVHDSKHVSERGVGDEKE